MTVAQWVRGRVLRGRRIPGLVRLASARPPVLSFTNLVEVHVIDAIRQVHGLPLRKIRDALRYLERESEHPHPLVTEGFSTDNVDLFVERYGQLVNASAGGQVAMRDREVLGAPRA